MKKYIIVTSVILCTMATYAKKEVYVDLSNQIAYAVDGEEIVFDGRISSGRKGRETPTGKFKITEKEKHHISNLWPKPNGGAKMPYMMRLSGSSIAMHLGHVPNYPASHGCIRLEPRLAKKMYKWAPIGTPVYVEGSTEDFIIAPAKKKSKKRIAHKRRKRDQMDVSRNKSRLAIQEADYRAEREFEAMGYYKEDIPEMSEDW